MPTSARIDSFIGGRRVSNEGAIIDNIDPATGESLGQVVMDSVATADAAVQAAHEAYPACAALMAVSLTG